MAVDDAPTLAEAVTEFLAGLQAGERQETQQELNRFVRWCGRDRRTSTLLPTEVAEYAEWSGAWSAVSNNRLAAVKFFLSFLKKRSYIQTPLAPHMKVVRAKKQRASGPQQPQETAVLTPEGHSRLQARLELLKEERARVREDVQRAMADKDFRENAPLDAAKERQGYIESSLRELEGVLARAVVSESHGATPGRKVTLGKTVVLRDSQSGRRLTYTLVNLREADPAAGRISDSSPVGRALMGRLEGEEVQIVAPRGAFSYVIERVGV